MYHFGGTRFVIIYAGRKRWRSYLIQGAAGSLGSRRRMPVEYSTSSSARSRKPIGSSISRSTMIFSTSAAEKMFFGSDRPRRGGSNSDAGLCRM